MKKVFKICLCLLALTCALMAGTESNAKVKVKSVKLKSNYGKINVI